MKNKLILMSMFSLCYAALASVVLPLSEEKAFNDADLIVLGEVIDKTSNWENTGKTIVTDNIIRIIDVIYPEITEGCPPNTIKKENNCTLIVETLGGSAGDISLSVPGSPKFSTGIKLIFLLQSTKKNCTVNCEEGTYRIVGFSQGLCSLDNENHLNCSYSSQKQTSSQMKSKTKKREPITLTEFKKKVRTIKNKTNASRGK